ncbi:15720_t:CDS:2 [Cetraspora pellucida]|uniref:15720_t:CDS:1 n=1 Tax=Cetraspora pellucida TaxID=1433469 RepID=A0A9N9AIG4_9GLOM|nr:15720_t:CDS:2 [Cetraspora pellucida]
MAAAVCIKESFSCIDRSNNSFSEPVNVALKTLTKSENPSIEFLQESDKKQDEEDEADDSILQIHPEAIYTCRIMDLGNLNEIGAVEEENDEENVYEENDEDNAYEE